MATVEVTKGNFEDTTAGDGIVIVDAWAEWCGPCKRFAPVFDKASEEHGDITFAKLDTENNQDLAGELQIQAIPTLMVYRDGIEVFNQAGALPPAAFEDLIKQVRDLDMDKVRELDAQRKNQG
ncbi:thioredoxin [Corynebacterium sp. L4756]|uniref:thioredoxin n=1 Tax=unclassified Corynebacterium TaxID=2624378 RepID=UPI00374D5C48